MEREPVTFFHTLGQFDPNILSPLTGKFPIGFFRKKSGAHFELFSKHVTNKNLKNIKINCLKKLLKILINQKVENFVFFNSWQIL